MCNEHKLKPKKCLGCFHAEKTFEYPDISHEKFCETVSKIYPSLIITGTYYNGLKLISCTCKDCGYHSFSGIICYNVCGSK